MIDPTTNEALALAAQAGDERAFDTLWLRLYAPLRQRMQFKGWRYHDAEEVAAEALYQAASSLQRFDPELGSFGSWLATIALRVSFTRMQHNTTLGRGGRERADAPLQAVSPDVASILGPEPVVMWRETVREAWALVQAKGNLTQKLTFAAVIQNGDMLPKEVAEIVGVNAHTVSCAIYNLQRDLAPLLDWQQGEAPPPPDLTPRRLGNRARSGATHCGQGHEFTEENTILLTKGGRKCRLCQRVWQREYDRHRRKTAVQAAA